MLNRDRADLARLIPLLAYKPWVTAAIVIFGLLASLFEGLGISLLIPVLQGLIEGNGSQQSAGLLVMFLMRITAIVNPNDRLWALPALMFIAIAFKNICSYCNLALTARLQHTVRHQLRTRVYKQLLSVSNLYLETQNSGEIQNTLSRETWTTGEAIAKMNGLATTVSTAVVYILLLLLISPLLTIIIATSGLVISWVVQWLMRSLTQRGQEAVKSQAYLSVRMLEGIIGMRTIRVFGRENYEQERFDSASKDVKDRFIELDNVSAVTQPLHEVLSTVLVLLVLMVALQYNRNILPEVFTFLFMLYRLQPQMQAIEGYRSNLRSLAGSIDNVFKFLDPSDKHYINSGAISCGSRVESIRFENVSFSYLNDNQLALKDVTFSIPIGKTTAIVGPSGAGKSTVIQLISRFFDPIEGKVLINSHDLSTLDLGEWRSRMAIVSQDIHIFNDSIAGNIAYGRLDATRGEIIDAAHEAHADEFIRRMPDGYDTQVGDRGMRLSGGQRQRIALARAIIRDPDLLILDEATNALDSISEQLIQEALLLFSRNRTVVLIAHRLSTIEQADQIIVLERGELKELGDLRSLLSEKGLFHTMYGIQNPALNP